MEQEEIEKRWEKLKDEDWIDEDKNWGRNWEWRRQNERGLKKRVEKWTRKKNLRKEEKIKKTRLKKGEKWWKNEK